MLQGVEAASWDSCAVPGAWTTNRRWKWAWGGRELRRRLSPLSQAPRGTRSPILPQFILRYDPQHHPGQPRPLPRLIAGLVAMQCPQHTASTDMFCFTWASMLNAVWNKPPEMCGFVFEVEVSEGPEPAAWPWFNLSSEQWLLDLTNQTKPTLCRKLMPK